MSKDLVCGLCLLLAGCSFGQWGRDLGSGVVEGASEGADSLSHRLVGGALDTLMAAETQRRMNEMLERLGATLALQVAETRDSLLGNSTNLMLAQLRDELLGQETRAHMGSLREELLGAHMRYLLSRIREEVLGDSMRALVAQLRDELLGPRTQHGVSVIVDSAMTSLVARYREDLKPVLEGQIGFIQKNATWLLILIAGLAIAIIAFVWWQKRKYTKMLGMLTLQIHEIPDRTQYDELTDKIQRQAKQSGLEVDLRKFLAEQGTLGLEAWAARNG
jgi:hypothetical protein